MVELITCISFEHAVGILSCQYQLQTFCYSDNTCTIPLQARRGGGDGGDPVAPVGGALDPRLRHLQQAFRPPLAGLGGRAWGWRAWLPPLPCAALLLLLFPLLVGRGGEELGGRELGRGRVHGLSGVPLDPGAPTLRLVVFFASVQWASMGEAGGAAPEDDVPFQ
jgi:hypothetical protein